MKAVELSRFGGPEVLEVVDRPNPEPGAGEVLVRVHAAGVNFADTLMRQDRYAVSPPLPSILGSEVAGVIEGTGGGVDPRRLGTRVAVPLFATANPSGGYAEFVVVDADRAVPVPNELSFPDAVALMVQGLSALHLVQQAPPRGKRVLVNAAAGGVGSFLVQLARDAGAASIIAAASSLAKLDFARSLGADHGVDYTAADWPSAVSSMTGGVGPDIIYESAGGPITRDSLAALAPLGRMVIFGALNIHDFQLGIAELRQLIFKNQSISGFALVPLLDAESLRGGLADLFRGAANGSLKVTIGASFSLDNAAEAHRSIDSRRTMGKIILVP